jgi:hypothetical protein
MAYDFMLCIKVEMYLDKYLDKDESIETAYPLYINDLKGDKSV